MTNKINRLLYKCKKKEVNKMTRTELEKRIHAIDEEIFYEEMADRGYNFRRVSELKAEMARLEKELKNL